MGPLAPSALTSLSALLTCVHAMASRRNLDADGDYDAVTPKKPAHNTKKVRAEVNHPNSDDASSSSDDSDSGGDGGAPTADIMQRTLQKMGDAVSMLAKAASDKNGNDAKLGAALNALAEDDEDKRRRRAKAKDARARRYGAPPPPPAPWDQEIIEVDGVHAQEIGDLVVQDATSTLRNAAVKAYINTLLARATTADSRDATPGPTSTWRAGQRSADVFALLVLGAFLALVRDDRFQRAA